MAEIRHLTRAPVTEALIDFRVQAPEGISFEALEQRLGREDFGYVKKGPIVRGSFGFSLDLKDEPVGKAMAPQTAVIGQRFESGDGKYVAQFSVEGFTLSRLPPYESWKGLIAETRRVWPIYRRCVNTSTITRVATRFINNLRLPLTSGQAFQRYLQALPDFAPQMPQAMSRFLQQCELRDAESNATVIFTQALEQPGPESSAPVIVDVDAFREHRFPAGGEEVWSYLEHLHTLKNQVFFSAITEEAVALYL
jgi:uncharacterized protein (TIGR04255 family)